jgi:4-amino-4-deoxy-L-arabinose transferase-like glycosyltransferase
MQVSSGDDMKPFGTLAESGPAAEMTASNDDALTSRVRIAAWCLLLLAGLIETVFSRHAMQDDGINYLDMGDAIVRGDWHMALNGIWSPLYPFLQGLALRIIKPSSYSQFTVVHGVNFLIYVFALACFDFLLRVAVDRPGARGVAARAGRLPKWAVFAVSYSVFLWSSLSAITLQKVTPDLLMAGFLYLAAALLLQIWSRPQKLSRFVLLGVALGLGYLAKSPMFPLAFLFFALAWIGTSSWRKAAPRVFAALLAFLAVSGPWFIALSHAKGRLMFSDTARFNYVLHVNGAGPDWYFRDLGTATGHFVHPVRQIFDAPPVYEFAAPVPGTSPVAYDPSYWSQGAVPQASLKTELQVIHHWLRYYFDIFLSSQTVLLLGFLVLCLLPGRELFFKQLTAQWQVWVIGLAGLAMYALVHAELRYVAAFFTLCWVGLFSGLRMPSSRHGRRLASLVTLVVVVVMAAPAVMTVARQLKQTIQRPPHDQWQVAEDLHRLGVAPGDRVARLPAHFGLAWARLLGVTDVAEIPIEHSSDFWCAKPETQAQLFEALRRVGVTAIVAEQSDPLCPPGPGWQKLGDGTYHALKLEPNLVKLK